jgi:hypothetical protein
MDQMGMVSAFKIEVLLLAQAVVHHDVEPICRAERRNRTRLAIRKQNLDLLLASDIHPGAK